MSVAVSLALSFASQLVISVPPRPRAEGAVSYLSCKAVLRSFEVVSFSAEFVHDRSPWSGQIRFRVSNPLLPLGDQPVPVRLYSSTEPPRGGVKAGDGWIIFEMKPIVEKVEVTTIEFRRQALPPEKRGTLNGEYATAICQVRTNPSEPESIVEDPA